MPRPIASQPTDGELEILHVLWDQGPVALSDICSALRSQRDVATTTVATMLRIMSDKRLVKRNGEGRGATWSAVVSRHSTAKGMVNQLVERVFEGSAQRLAAHLVEGGRLSADQLAELRQLIDQQVPTRRNGDSTRPHAPEKQ